MINDQSQMTIVIINGPNLNRLGLRNPEIYGNRTMAQILLDIQQRWPDIHFVYRQSNHEGDLIDWIQEVNDESPMTNDQSPMGIILNAGGYTHTSVALLDAVKAVSIPTVEVHISHVDARDEFRRVSYIRAACVAMISGRGLQGYLDAIDLLVERFAK